MNTQPDLIRISEIFGPTIQGEGALIGQPTVFVRTGGCDYRCAWCDTLHAVDSAHRHEWKPMRAQEIFEQVEALSGGVPVMVSLSGGNPAIQPLGELIDLGHARGYRFALETQGSIAKDWFSKLDVLTLSPKPPSSCMGTDLEILKDCISRADQNTKIALKFVVLDALDYAYAKDLAALFPSLPVYLQPCNATPPDVNGEGRIAMEDIHSVMRDIVNRVVSDRWYNVCVLPQLHVILWGNKRGV